MSHQWVKVPGDPGDGEMTVAGPKGPIRLVVIDGVVRWPEELGKPHSSLKPGSPSPRAVEAYRQETLGRIAEQRRRLDEELASLEDASPESGSATPAAPPALTPSRKRAPSSRTRAVKR